MRLAVLALATALVGCASSAAKSSATPEPGSEPEAEPEPKIPAIATVAQGSVVALAESRLPRYLTITGDRVYWSNGAGEVGSVPVGGGETTIHYQPGPGSRALARVITSDEDAVYFTTRSGIHRLDPSTGQVELQADVPEALYVSVDDRYLYFTRFGKAAIWRVSKNGGVPITLARSRLASSLTPHGDYLYWTSYGEGTINRVHRETRRRKVLARSRHPTGLAVVGSYILWSTERDGSIHTMSLEARGRPRTIVRGARNHDVLKGDGTYVYWGSWVPKGKGQISRIDPSGGDIEILAVELRSPVGLAVTQDHVFVANKGEGTILRVDKHRLATPPN